jgi:exonuclease SbcC
VKLRYLKLDHYRSYAAAEVEFPAGLSALVGPNGAGKSTLLEAVTWALFGRSRTAKEDMRSHFAPDRAACRVEVVFEIQGSAYRVVRELRGRALTAHARLTREGDGAPLAEGAGAVEAQVEALLGMNSATFFASVFSRQKQVDALTEIGPGKREEAFRRMLGLDALDDVVKQIRSDAKDLRNELKGLEEKRRDPSALEAAKARCWERLESLRPRIERAQEAARSAAEAEGRAQAEFDRLHALEQRHAELDKARGQLDERAAQIARSLDQTRGELEQAAEAKRALDRRRPALRELEDVRGRLRDLEPARDRHVERESLRARRAQLDGRLAADRTAVEALRARLAPLDEALRDETALREQVESARSQVDEARQAAAGRRAELDGFQRDVARLDEQIGALQSLGAKGTCPVCLQPLGASFEAALGHAVRERDERAARAREAREAASAAERAAAARKDALDALAARHGEARARLDQLRRVESDAEARDAAARRLAEDLASIDRSLDAPADVPFDPDMYNQLRARGEALAPLERECARLEASAGRIADLERRFGAGEAERADVAERLRDLSGRIAALGYEPAHMARAREAQAGARKARAEREAERNALEQERVAREKDLEKAEADIADERRLEALTAEKGRRIDQLNLLEQVFGAFRQHLTDRIRPALAARAGALLASTTGGRYAQVELDDDYNVRVFDGGAMRPLERFSGGESDLINLCLRIAISQVVAGRSAGRVNLLVLDEVFGSQDPQRRDAILRGLRALPGEFQQVLVITHDESLKDRMEGVLVVRRPDGVRSEVGRA